LLIVNQISVQVFFVGLDPAIQCQLTFYETAKFSAGCSDIGSPGLCGHCVPAPPEERNGVWLFPSSPALITGLVPVIHDCDCRWADGLPTQGRWWGNATQLPLQTMPISFIQTPFPLILP